MECCRGPNRSDVHASVEEEAKIEKETREYFQGIAPTRHTKPQRSDYSTQYVDAADAAHSNANIPEFVEFQRLEKDTQKLIYKGREATEEFVETEYYNDLNCVDKQHHTTGTGFIAIDNSNGKCFSLGPDSATTSHTDCKGNPATNDWVPAAADMVTLVSDKPRRSDN